MEQKNRLDYFDIAKGICFIAVVWGHFMSPYGTVFCYTFNLPAFFVISGYFMNKKKRVNVYCALKFEQLLIPYLSTGAVMIVLAALLQRDPAEWAGRVIYGAGLEPAMPFMKVGFVGPIWFFPALLFALSIARVGIVNPLAVVFVIFSVMVGYASSWIVWLPFGIQAGMVLSGYVYTGYVAKRLVEWIRPHIPDGIIWPVTGVLTAIFVNIWFWYYSGEESCVLFCINEYPRGLVDYVGPLFAIFSVILLCAYIVRYIPYVSAGLRWIGENTLTMLCIHTVDTMFFEWKPLQAFEDPVTWRTLVLIIVCKFVIYTGLTIVWRYISKAVSN